MGVGKSGQLKVIDKTFGGTGIETVIAKPADNTLGIQLVSFYVPLGTTGSVQVTDGAKVLWNSGSIVGPGGALFPVVSPHTLEIDGALGASVSDVNIKASAWAVPLG